MYWSIIVGRGLRTPTIKIQYLNNLFIGKINVGVGTPRPTGILKDRPTFLIDEADMLSLPLSKKN